MDKELNSLIGTELKSQILDSRNDILRTDQNNNVITDGLQVTVVLHYT